MKLYNSLKHKAQNPVEEFTPHDSKRLTIYSCGPTVYDRAHIGNLAAFIYADTLRRVLSSSFPETKVEHVMNITDVNDKTIQRSHEQYPKLDPMEAQTKLTRQHEALFMQDLEAVGVDTSSVTFVRATGHIQEMQVLIKKLLEAGIAYVADDGIYFSITKYEQSGKTYGQLVDITPDITNVARINNDEYDKADAHDFALWKKQKPGEPMWGFEVNGQNMDGRPGWHIECSVMSVTSLGQPFDIHTGGVDLKFPHHENEIAQSTGGSAEQLLARVFFHNEHILVDGQKMAKSLQNFYTLEDVIQKGFDPLAFRLLVLQAHYRSQAHFSWPNLAAAQNRLLNIRNFVNNRFQYMHEKRTKLVMKNGTYVTEEVTDFPDKIEESVIKTIGSLKNILSSLQNDLDTPTALRYAAEFSELQTSNFDDQQLAAFAETIDQLFGLDLSKQTDIADEDKQLIQAREAARQAQDWTKADELRKQLEERGIGLNDTGKKTTWYRL